MLDDDRRRSGLVGRVRLHHLVVSQRAIEQPALTEPAVQLEKQHSLRLGFDALGHDLEPQFTTEIHDRVHDGARW